MPSIVDVTRHASICVCIDTANTINVYMWCYIVALVYVTPLEAVSPLDIVNSVANEDLHVRNVLTLFDKHCYMSAH